MADGSHTRRSEAASGWGVVPVRWSVWFLEGSKHKRGSEREVVKDTTWVGLECYE